MPCSRCIPPNDPLIPPLSVIAPYSKAGEAGRQLEACQNKDDGHVEELREDMGLL